MPVLPVGIARVEVLRQIVIPADHVDLQRTRREIDDLLDVAAPFGAADRFTAKIDRNVVALIAGRLEIFARLGVGAALGTPFVECRSERLLCEARKCESDQRGRRDSLTENSATNISVHLSLPIPRRMRHVASTQLPRAN